MSSCQPTRLQRGQSHISEESQALQTKNCEIGQTRSGSSLGQNRKRISGKTTRVHWAKPQWVKPHFCQTNRCPGRHLGTRHCSGLLATSPPGRLLCGSHWVRHSVTLLCPLLLQDWYSGCEIPRRQRVQPHLFDKSERFVAPLQEQTYSKIQMVLQHCHCQCQQ